MILDVSVKYMKKKINWECLSSPPNNNIDKCTG